MGPKVDKGHMIKLVKEQSEELTMNELNELQVQQHMEILQEINTMEEPEEEEVLASKIKNILGMWERLSEFVERKHPENLQLDRHQHYLMTLT